MNDDLPLEENLGNQVAQLTQDLDRYQKALAQLVHRVGSPGRCRYCPAQILWVHHLDTSANAPYDPDGMPHWATCPGAAEARKQRRKA
jgi:hypothetical protein